jgi:hypothetical protein
MHGQQPDREPHYEESYKGGFLCSFKEQTRGFWVEAILPVRVVMMELNRNCLSDSVYISGFGGDDTGVLELDAVSD